MVELAPAAAPVAPGPCTTVCGTHTACGPALTLTRTAYQPWLCSSMFTNLCNATHSSTTATKPTRVRASPTYDSVASLTVVLLVWLLVPAFVCAVLVVVPLLVVMGAELFAAAPMWLALVVLRLVEVGGVPLVVVVELARRELARRVVEADAGAGGGLVAPEVPGELVVVMVDGEREGAVAVRWGLGGGPWPPLLLMGMG